MCFFLGFTPTTKLFRQRGVFAPRFFEPCAVQTKNTKIKCMYTATDIVQQFETLQYIKLCIFLLKFKLSHQLGTVCTATAMHQPQNALHRVQKRTKRKNTNREKATNVTLIFFLIKQFFIFFTFFLSCYNF